MPTQQSTGVPGYYSSTKSPCWQMERSSTPQVGLYTVPRGDGVGTWSPTWTTPISKAWTVVYICFPSYYQVYPLMLQLAILVNIRSPFIQLGRLEQCRYSFLLEETTVTLKIASLLIERLWVWFPVRPQTDTDTDTHMHTHTNAPQKTLTKMLNFEILTLNF